MCVHMPAAHFSKYLIINWTAKDLNSHALALLADVTMWIIKVRTFDGVSSAEWAN